MHQATNIQTTTTERFRYCVWDVECIQVEHVVKTEPMTEVAK